MSTRSFAFSVVLATYLTGLVIGSALYARWADRVRDPWGVFGVLIAAAGLVALLEIAGLGKWLVVLQTEAEGAVLALTGSQLGGMCTRFAVAAACIVFVPTALLGAAFPVALRLAVDVRHVGRDVGAVVALNTIGGIAGTILTGFVLVPVLGLVRTLAALAIAAAAVGIFAVMRGPAARRARWATLAIGLAAILGAILTPPHRLASLLPGARGGTLIFYEESLGGTVAVVEQQAGQTRFRRLYIQGVSNSGDAMPSLRYMRLQALLPLIIHGGEPRSALVIGLGTGITAGALLRFPGWSSVFARSFCQRSYALRRFSRGTSARRRTRGSTSASRWPSRAAAESGAVRSHHARAAATVGRGCRQSLFERLLCVGQHSASAGRPACPVVAASNPERRGLALSRAQLPRCLSACVALDHRVPRDAAHRLVSRQSNSMRRASPRASTSLK